MSIGKAIIFSAPSGSGKTTIAQYLLKKFPEQLGFSISACTREKRSGREENGKDYYFLSIEEFTQKIQKDEFVEWEEVYAGGYYGTLKTEVQRLWDNGKAIVFDVDVKGGINLKKYFKEHALSIFVKVPSIEVLEERLRSRNTESEESLKKRIFKAQFELSFQDQFDVVVVNEDLDKALIEVETIIKRFLNS
ncbi:MAG: guanylate kinase [Cytophagales bacterium]